MKRIRWRLMFLAIGACAIWYLRPRTPEVESPVAVSRRAAGAPERRKVLPTMPSAQANSVARKTDHETIVRLFKQRSHRLLAADTVNEVISKKRELEALLREQPELAKYIPAQLARDGLAMRPKLAMINSLAEVGTPEAQSTLLKIAASGSLSDNLRVQAMISSAELVDPKPEIISMLWDVSSRISQSEGQEVVANAALLSLGSLAGQLSENDPNQATLIAQELYSKLLAAEQRGDIRAVDYIDALGNTGTSFALDVADRYILSPSAEERALGASVLRKVRDARADAILFELLDTDEETVVRRAALQTIAVRTLDQERIERLSALLLEEPDASIRAEMVNRLGPYIQEYPLIEVSLRKLLELEDNSSNYNQIIEAISSNA